MSTEIASTSHGSEEVCFDDINFVEEIICDHGSTTTENVSSQQRGDQLLHTIHQNVEIQTPTFPAMCIDNFEKDDAGIHFYTGFETISKFYFVLTTLGPAAYSLNHIYHQVTNISVPDQFFLVLMKLRRHRTNFELSRLFNISEKKNCICLQWFGCI